MKFKSKTDIKENIKQTVIGDEEVQLYLNKHVLKWQNYLTTASPAHIRRRQRIQSRRVISLC